MKFQFNSHFSIDTAKEPWKHEGLRIGIFAEPGSGKSYTTAAFLIEPYLQQGGTLVVFQPRSEWHTLKEKFPDIQVVGGTYNVDVPFVTSQPKLYAEAVVRDGVSMIFSTGDVEDEEKLVEFVRSFMNHLMKLEEQYHRPILIGLEESQEYLPNNPKGHVAPPWVFNRMIKQFNDAYSQGRKLGINPVMISQRPQAVSFSSRQLCNLTLFGKISAQDATYVDKECLKPFREKGIKVSAKDLIDLQKGEWLVIHEGRADIEKLGVHRLTPHGADTPELKFIPVASDETKKKAGSLASALEEMQKRQEAEESDLSKSANKVRSLETKLAEATKKLELVSNLKDLFGQGSSTQALENAQKRIIELETELAAEMERRKTAEQSSFKVQELEQKIESNQHEIQSAAIFRSALKSFLDGTEIKLPVLEQSVQGESIEDHTVRANLDSIIKGPYTPEPARKMLKVFQTSAKGSKYSRTILASSAGLSPTSSNIPKALSWLKENKLVIENASGIKLYGE